MSQPTPYNRGFSFTDFAAANPSQSLPGVKVDVELDAIERTLDQSLTNLAKLQRDDGALANASVGVQQLAATTLALIGSDTFSVRGAWLTSTAYLRGDFYANANQVYLVMADHTSTSIAADIDSSKVVGPVFFPDTAQVAALVTALAQNTGAATIGTSIGSTVEAELTGIRTYRTAMAVSTAVSGASTVGAFDFQAGSKWTTVQGYITAILSQLGSSFVGFLQAGAGAVARTVQGRLRDRASLKDFGAIGDGVTDDTAAVQAFVNAGGGYIPLGTYKLSSAVEVPAGAEMQGQPASYMATTYTGRAMFFIAHTGKGFTCTGAVGGRSFQGFGTYRTQPALGVAWAPTAHDWDFYVDGATDVSFRDILLLNATKGIICTNGGGRFSFDKVWGQPFQVGIQIDTSYDVTRINDVHFWNFFTSGKANESYALDYTLANGTAIYSKRNDNPDFYDIFAIFYRHGLRIGNWSGGGAGTTKRLRCFGLGADACGGGITVDADANGFTADIYGLYAHGHDTVITSGSLIDVQGTNGTLRVYGRTDLSNAHRHAITVTGAGSHVAVEDPLIDVYNMAAGGYAAINAASGIFAISLRGDIGISGGVSGAAAYAGTGRINGPRLSYTPTVSPGTGTFTGSATITSAVYNVIDGECEVRVDCVLPTNNTGAGDIRVTVPIPIAAGATETGVGRNVTANKMMVAQPFPGSSNVALVYYDGTYPGATNNNLTFRLKYRI